MCTYVPHTYAHMQQRTVFSVSRWQTATHLAIVAGHSVFVGSLSLWALTYLTPYIPTNAATHNLLCLAMAECDVPSGSRGASCVRGHWLIWHPTFLLTQQHAPIMADLNTLAHLRTSRGAFCVRGRHSVFVGGLGSWALAYLTPYISAHAAARSSPWQNSAHLLKLAGHSVYICIYT